VVISHTSGRIVDRFGLDFHLAQVGGALSQRLGMADHFLDLRLLCSRKTDQAKLDTQEIFSDDEELVAQERIVILVDAAGQGVLDREHAVIALFGGDGIENRIE
jgi:hypothetical protein